MLSTNKKVGLQPQKLWPCSPVWQEITLRRTFSLDWHSTSPKEVLSSEIPACSSPLLDELWSFPPSFLHLVHIFSQSVRNGKTLRKDILRLFLSAIKCQHQSFQLVLESKYVQLTNSCYPLRAKEEVRTV